MRDKYIFRETKIEDIPQMVEIEKQFFKNGVAFSKEFLENWFKYNPKMFFVVTDNSNKILAFTILVPINADLYNKLKNGIVKDMIDFKKEDVLTSVQSEYYYVADAASSNKNLRASLTLFKGITEFLGQNAHFVLATPITEDGFAICKSFGFKELDSDNSIGKNLEIEVTNSLKKRFIKKNKKG